MAQPLHRPELEASQLQRLRQLVALSLESNAFQRLRLSAAGVVSEDLRSLADLRRLPFTTKAELAADQVANPPFGSNLTFPVERYSRLHQTSGTTGSPLRWLDTPESWDWLMQCWRQLFDMMGLRPTDRLFFPFSFGPFLGFWAGFDGANRHGHLCLAAGGMSSIARLQFLRETGATVVCCTPTYALRLAEVAVQEGVDLKATAVRAILVAGEAGGNIPATRELISNAWGARVVDHWGMTEIGPMAIETEHSPNCLTVLETECIAEIIDPATGSPAPPGTEGELVITTLGRLGSPIFRYRTGDRVRSIPGNGLLQLDGGILGRVDEMLTIRGNNLYPAALEEIVRRFPDVAEFRIEVLVERAMQHVRIEIEPLPAATDAAELCRQISETIRLRWNFQAEVVPVKELPRFELKGKRFFKRSR